MITAYGVHVDEREVSMEHLYAVIYYDPSQRLVMGVEEVDHHAFTQYRDVERFSAPEDRPEAVEHAIAKLPPYIKEFKVVSAR